MSHVREKHNSKARQSTAGSRKKGKLKRKRAPEEDVGEEPDANALIQQSKTKEEKEMERKERLKQELIAQSESKWTSKKTRRLEKYIDKKLKKEERVQILEKLSQSQAEISSLNLNSSSTLGTGRASTHKEQHDKQEDKEVRRALAGVSGRRKRQTGFSVVDVESDEEDHQTDIGLYELSGKALSPPESAKELKPEAKKPHVPPEVGSALQRNPDGSLAAPTLRFAGWGKRKQVLDLDAQEDNSSFDSSDSAHDTASPEANSDQDDTSSGGSGAESDDDQELGDPPETPEQPRKSLGFKDWALKQLENSKTYMRPKPDEPPSTDPDIPEPAKKKRKVKDNKPNEMRGPLGEDLKLPETAFAQQFTSDAKEDVRRINQAKAVHVTRPPDVENARLLLPIVTEEQAIMEAIMLHPVVMICGETGSGKTTQVPQFLYEAGFGTSGTDNPGMIGITQPRRVAVMSMAARVAHELSLTSSKVSYQIRYDATVSPSTSIKFMTDGVLLRELATDFLLSKYSVVIIDEAHERGMNTDILIGVLSRVMQLREEMWKSGKDNIKPLRLIIMSATLRVSDFAENKTLFPKPPPVVNVAARQHPVTVHFSRKTSRDYVIEAIKKTVKIHTRLPPGGVLVFLTGQNEITGVCRKLEARFGRKVLEEKRKRSSATAKRIHDAALGLADSHETQRVAPAQADVEAEDVELGTERADDLALDADDGLRGDEDMDALDTDEEDEEGMANLDDSDVPMHVVPLYSLLPNEKQMRVFEPPPPGHRLVVVSTNVAETSLTIPGIRYVVDCGRAKERRYDLENGIQAFQVSWISKASAAQRAGRAGRTGPGHCYRLYSSALFENYFDKFAKPEILRMPIEGVVLQMKAMHIDAVINFPFPTPPDRLTLQKAEKVLINLGALRPGTALTLDIGSMTGGQITELGKTMSLFPLSPRFARMLVVGHQHRCLPYVIAIVAALSVEDPFLHDEGLFNEDDKDEKGSDSEDEGRGAALTNVKEARRQRRKAFFQSHQTHSALGKSSSDIFKVLSVVGAYEYAGGGLKFCEEHFVRAKAMEEIHKLRSQISNVVGINFPGVDAGFIPKLKPPTDLQLKVLKQLITAGFIDQVAVRNDRIDQSSSTGNQYATSKGVPYKAMGIEEDVFIHPSSVLSSGPPPEYLVFHEVVRTSHVWIKGLTVINPAWLSSLGKGTLCTFSKPAKNNLGVMMVIPRFGPHSWELPAIKADILS
ncbi:P-loop containing nucleoside triphosphate hydrolase protein [Pluteus cervinus]|uniref:P-loop containing nucleoside triphosphate hydrolase protein n=1 Tax=Pluteus cervinus TaxID=181527 RepID=A0ACD3B9N4_9AGAR|nr:P-loop containing nucleoside triphosphate hydrolase protein [Pluteus cervinus]